jgi:hypothetical protein
MTFIWITLENSGEFHQEPLYNVPIGNHFFEAIDIDGAWWGYHGQNQYITAGINYVYLYPSGIPVL